VLATDKWEGNRHHHGSETRQRKWTTKGESPALVGEGGALGRLSERDPSRPKHYERDERAIVSHSFNSASY
jgi:hypothetical protein